MSPYRHHFEERSLWHHLWANAYGAAFGVLFVLFAIGNLAGDAGSSTVARATEAGATDEVWSAFVGVGGLFILCGLVRRDARAEFVGLLFSTVGLLIAILAVLRVLGINDATRLALSTYTAAAVGQSARLAWLVYCNIQVRKLHDAARALRELAQP